MPIYEYICPECGKRFEKFWRTVDMMPEGINCPYCNTLSPRVFSPFSFQFSPYLKDLGTDRMMDY